MTSTDYRNPYRPVPVRLFNRIGAAGARLGLSGPLEVDSLLRAAQRKTRLSDFGDDGFLPALEVLVDSLNDEAQLTPTGRVIQKSRLIGALIHRLRIEELIRQHPEIDSLELPEVIMVTGLQRTGTTLLQRTLNALPGVRGVSGGEGLVPVATINASKRSERVRERRGLLAKRTISYLAPDFMAIHQIDPNEPEEDVLLLDLCFMSQSAEATLHVPTYAHWLENQDHTQPYQYFRRVLKVLCWQQPAGALVLKTPQHLEYLDVFLKVFGDATIAWTHRDPRISVASFCSMVAHSRGIFSDDVDPTEIGEHWFRKTQRMVELAMQTRSASNTGRFVDISYYDLVNDPLAEVRRICELAGIGFDEQRELAARRYLEAHPQNRFGRHDYGLADFGLSTRIVDEAFASYRQTNAIPFE